MRVHISLFFLLISFCHAEAQDIRLLISGRVYEADSTTPVVFAYILNSRTEGGAVSDAQGRFKLFMYKTDTLHVSCIGRQTQTIAISSLLSRSRGDVINLDIYLQVLPVKLRSALVIALRPPSSKISDEQFYKGVIKDYTIKRSHKDSALNGMPTRSYYGVISNLLMPLTHKGEEIKKFRNLFLKQETEKVVNGRFTEDLIRELTGLPYTRVEAFKRHCKFSNEFVLSSSDYDFYRAIRHAFVNFIQIEKDTVAK